MRIFSIGCYGIYAVVRAPVPRFTGRSQGHAGLLHYLAEYNPTREFATQGILPSEPSEATPLAAAFAWLECSPKRVSEKPES